MLYRLECENFYSLRDKQVLDLTVSPNVPDPDDRYAPIFPGSKLRAPKVVAVYGANASGKSTVLKALEFLVSFIRDSASTALVSGFPCSRFNDDASLSRHIWLAAELGGVMDISSDRLQRAGSGDPDIEFGTLRYELCIEVREGLPYRVQMEALRQRPNGVGKWQRVFERDADGQVKGSKAFPIAGYQHLLNTLRPNASVIASFSMFEHPTAKTLAETSRTTVSNLGTLNGADESSIIRYLASNPEILAELNRDLRRVDLGLEEMRIHFGPNGPEAMFRHSGLAVEMPIQLESHGTRAFIRLFPLLAIALSGGGIAIMDELDGLMHPLILPEILRWFYDSKGRNGSDAQLWFSCHSVSLFDDLNKEEVVVCEKDRAGRTRVHSLMDVKVRRDDNLYRKYMSGALGGVPQIG